MIYFFADNHFEKHSGREIYRHLPEEIRKRIRFFEDDWTLLEQGSWEKDCSLLILHMIALTSGQPHPGPGAEKAVRAYCERGGNLLLLHGSSAAFWQWDWWRTFCGLRWVRQNDPDGVAASTHPVEPFHLEPAKVRHPLGAFLKPFDLPTDEIYIHLEQTSPITVLMNTTIASGTYPMLYETASPFGGRVMTFLPGHGPETTSNPDLLSVISLLISDLRKGAAL